METINVELLRGRLEHITEHRAAWDQRYWATKTPCGTAGCIAGHVVMEAGYIIVWSSFTSPNGTVYGDFTSEGDLIGHVARELLGLTLAQAADLFDQNNSLYRLWLLSSEFTNGAIQVPEGVEPDEYDRARAADTDPVF